MNTSNIVDGLGEYNTDILISNIENRLISANISRRQFADETGIYQSRVSNILNGTRKGCFTVVQLVAIAKFFNCSVDELLGIETKEEKQDVTMADILDLLFQIDKKEPLIIDYMDTGKRFTNDEGRVYSAATGQYYAMEGTERVIGFAFKEDSFDKVLEAWKSLKETQTPKMLKYDIIKMWKEKTIKTGAMRSRRYDYKTSKEKLLALCESILDNDEPIDYLSVNDYEALISNIDSLKDCFTDEDYQKIKDRLEMVYVDDTFPSWYTFDDTFV